MLLYSVDLLTFVLFFLCLNYKNDNISLLALTNNIYFIGGESYGASIEHSFLTRKQGLFQLFKFDTFSRWVTVCTTAFEVQAASTVTPKTVMYVEVNNHDFNNVGKYTLAEPINLLLIWGLFLRPILIMTRSIKTLLISK